MKLRSDTGEGSQSDDEDWQEDSDLGGSHGAGSQMLGNDLASVFKN